MRWSQQNIQWNWEDNDRDYYNNIDDVAWSNILGEDIESNKGDYIMNIEWNYNYYQPWSDNEWLVDKMLAMLDKDITIQ